MWSSYGLSADNNSASPLTSMDMKADYICLYSSSGTELVMAPTATVNIASVGAGGRDQSSAFAVKDDVWIYWIWSSGAGLSCIASKNVPSAGPTLPTGYTHYCPAFLSKIFAGPAFIRHSARGNQVSYIGAPCLDGSSAGYPTVYWDVSEWIPAKAGMTKFLINGEMHSSAAPMIAGVTAGTPGYNFVNMSLYAYSVGQWAAMTYEVSTVLPENKKFTVTYHVSAGATDNAVCYLFISGYTF